MIETFEVRAIGHVRSPRDDVIDDDWGGVIATIEIDTGEVPVEALIGIESFSHLEVVFLFDRVDPSKIHLGARHPRGLAHLPKVGILAQRAKARPNRLGVSRCRLLGRDGNRLTVIDLDAINGTPVLDIKPWLEAFGPRGSTNEPEWVNEVMENYYREN